MYTGLGHGQTLQSRTLKGDGTDGEPDARRKLEFEKKDQNWLELKNYGWFRMIFENIQSDLPLRSEAKIDLVLVNGM